VCSIFASVFISYIGGEIAMLIEVQRDGTRNSMTVSSTVPVENIVKDDLMLSGKSSSLRDIYCSNLISFPDVDDDADNSQFYGLKPPPANVVDVPNSVIVMNDNWSQNSIWDIDIFGQKADQNPSRYFYSKFEGFMTWVFGGLEVYRHYGNNQLPTVTFVFFICWLVRYR
jgi:hypothetical protein